jgi:hypothetical protein
MNGKQKTTTPFAPPTLPLNLPRHFRPHCEFRSHTTQQTLNMKISVRPVAHLEPTISPHPPRRSRMVQGWKPCSLRDKRQNSLQRGISKDFYQSIKPEPNLLARYGSIAAATCVEQAWGIVLSLGIGYPKSIRQQPYPSTCVCS